MPTQFWVFFNLILLNISFSTKLQESYPFIKLHREVGVPVRKVQNLILQFLCDDGGTEWITKSWRNIFVGFFPNFFLLGSSNLLKVASFTPNQFHANLHLLTSVDGKGLGRLPPFMHLFISSKTWSVLSRLPPLIHWEQSDNVCEFHMLGAQYASSSLLSCQGYCFHSCIIFSDLLFNTSSTGSARWEMFGSWRTQMPNSGIQLPCIGTWAHGWLLGLHLC